VLIGVGVVVAANPQNGAIHPAAAGGAVSELAYQVLAGLVRVWIAFCSPWWAWVLMFCVGMVLIAEFT